MMMTNIKTLMVMAMLTMMVVMTMMLAIILCVR